jgi:hypothetical protein
MPQLVLFPTALTCMQLTGFEIDWVHKPYPPPLPLDESDNLSITLSCRMSQCILLYVLFNKQPKLQGHFLIIKIIYQIMKLGCWLMMI